MSKKNNMYLIIPFDYLVYAFLYFRLSLNYSTDESLDPAASSSSQPSSAEKRVTIADPAPLSEPESPAPAPYVPPHVIERQEWMFNIAVVNEKKLVS